MYGLFFSQAGRIGLEISLSVPVCSDRRPTVPSSPIFAFYSPEQPCVSFLRTVCFDWRPTVVSSSIFSLNRPNWSWDLSLYACLLLLATMWEAVSLTSVLFTLRPLSCLFFPFFLSSAILFVFLSDSDSFFACDFFDILSFSAVCL